MRGRLSRTPAHTTHFSMRAGPVPDGRQAAIGARAAGTRAAMISLAGKLIQRCTSDVLREDSSSAADHGWRAADRRARQAPGSPEHRAPELARQGLCSRAGVQRQISNVTALPRGVRSPLNWSISVLSFRRYGWNQLLASGPDVPIARWSLHDEFPSPPPRGPA